MKRLTISLLLLLSMLLTMLPMTLGASADEGTAGAEGSAQAPLTYEDFYVERGLSVLLLAYDPNSGDITLNDDGTGSWKNRLTDKPFEAATLGVYIHGLAGDAAAEALGEYSLMASDLLSKIPVALRSILGKFNKL